MIRNHGRPKTGKCTSCPISFTSSILSFFTISLLLFIAIIILMLPRYSRKGNFGVPPRFPIRKEEGKAEREICGMKLRDALEPAATVLDYEISSSIDTRKVLVDYDTDFGGRRKIVSTGVLFLGVKGY